MSAYCIAYRNFHRLRFDVFYQVFRSCHNIISITIPLQSHALHFPFLPLAILLIPLRHTIITSAMNGPAGHARDLPLSVTTSTSPHTIPASASSIHPTHPSSQFHSQTNTHPPHPSPKTQDSHRRKETRPQGEKARTSVLPLYSTTIVSSQFGASNTPSDWLVSAPTPCVHQLPARCKRPTYIRMQGFSRNTRDAAHQATNTSALGVIPCIHVLTSRVEVG